jgi:hypothetical protein
VNELEVYINIPLTWNVTVERQPNGEYKLTYVEVVEKPEWMSIEDFEGGAKGTVEIVRDIMKRIDMDGEVNAKLQDGKCIIELHATGTLEHVAGLIAAEFLPFSRVGNLKLRDLLVYSLAGIFGVEKLEKVIALKPQPIEMVSETVKEATLTMDPEKLPKAPDGREIWCLQFSSRGELLGTVVTREMCPEIEELKKGDKITIKLRGNRVVKVERAK